jgi:hypothetical protein
MFSLLSFTITVSILPLSHPFPLLIVEQHKLTVLYSGLGKSISDGVPKQSSTNFSSLSCNFIINS